MKGGRKDRVRPASHSPRPRFGFPGSQGLGAPLSANAREALRGIRDMVDAEGVFAQSDEVAARAAGMTIEQARRALSELSGRGMIRLARAPRTPR